MNGLGILLRRAVRLVRRAPVRSSTTGLLVMAAVLAGVLWLSVSGGHRDANNSAASQLGRADVRYTLWPSESTVSVSRQVDGVVAALPDGADVEVVESFENLRLGADFADLTVHQGRWGDPLLEGVANLADGRWPGRGEVVVPPKLAASTGLDLGDELAIVDPPAVLEVVGLGSTGWDDGLLVAPGEFVASEAVSGGTTAPPGYTSVLATLPRGEEPPDVPVGTANGDGQVAYPFTRDDLFTASATGPAGVVVLAAGFVGLSAGATFAIGAARRRRALGLLAANGAAPGQLRLAAGAEALVVSVPAVALGVGAAIAVPAVWVRLRWAGWERIWEADVSPGWVGLLAVSAVVAAVVGTIVFSGSATHTTVPALLDQRNPVRRPTERSRWGVWVFVPFLVAAVLALPFLGVLVERGLAFGAILGLFLALLAWSAGVVAVGAFARRVLARHAVGRVVGRDLARRPLATGAAVIVVSVWSFAALMWAFQPLVQTSRDQDSVGIGVDENPDPAERPGESVEAASVSGTITIQPAPMTALRHRASSPVPTAVPGRLRDRLAELGLETRWATVAEFTGPCPVCPPDYRPTVMVLDSIDGLDLPASTREALRAGSAVTALDVEGVDGATVGGLPVTVAPLPLGAAAAMLAEFAPGDTALANRTEVLVGSTDGLTDAGAAGVVVELAAAGVSVVTDDLRVQPITRAEANGLGLTEPVDRDPLWWALSVVLLALVTMAATVAHRREHGEAAHVLWLLGAGPDGGRQLSALTAGTIATVGVLIGSTTATAVVAAAVARRSNVGIEEVFELRRVLTVLAVIIVVPAAAALLGRLLPPARSVRADVQPA